MTESPSWNEEQELAEFVPPEAGSNARSLQFLSRLLQTMDHPAYRAMAPGKQQL